MTKGFDSLPEAVRRKAITSFGTTAWLLADVEEAIEAARKLRLVNAGGEVQFRVEAGIYSAYWLCIRDVDRNPGETWIDFVNRGADQFLAGFRLLCEQTDFRKAAEEAGFRDSQKDALGCLVLEIEFFTNQEYR